MEYQVSAWLVVALLALAAGLALALYKATRGTATAARSRRPR